MTNLELMTAQQLRTAAKALLVAENLVLAGWTRNTYARDSLGRKTPPTADDACQFCAMGAMIAACHRTNRSILDVCALDVLNLVRYEVLVNLVLEADPRLAQTTVANFNDRTSTRAEDVSHMFRLGRKLAEKLAAERDART